jgi:hypothetical protein
LEVLQTKLKASEVDISLKGEVSRLQEELSIVDGKRIEAEMRLEHQDGTISDLTKKVSVMFVLSRCNLLISWRKPPSKLKKRAN